MIEKIYIEREESSISLSLFFLLNFLVYMSENYLIHSHQLVIIAITTFGRLRQFDQKFTSIVKVVYHLFGNFYQNIIDLFFCCFKQNI